MLAQLPPPSVASGKRYHFGDSHGLAVGKKRRRYEVVAAIDGEAVKIYNVSF